MEIQCAHWVEEQRGLRGTTRDAFAKVLSFRSKMVDKKHNGNQIEEGKLVPPPPRRRTTGVLKPFQKSSIRRVDTDLIMVDPTGRISRRVSTRDPPPDIIYQPESPIAEEQPGSPHMIFDSPKSQPTEFIDSKLGNVKAENGNSSASMLGNSPTTPVSTRPGDAAPATPRMVGFNVPMQSYATGASAAQHHTGNLRQRTHSAGIPRTRTFTEIDISVYS